MFARIRRFVRLAYWTVISLTVVTTAGALSALGIVAVVSLL